MIDPFSFIGGMTLAGFLGWITAPRPAVSLERLEVARCVVESRLIVQLKMPRRVAFRLANLVPVAFLPL